LIPAEHDHGRGGGHMAVIEVDRLHKRYREHVAVARRLMNRVGPGRRHTESDAEPA
jgi:hypothetical protein